MCCFYITARHSWSQQDDDDNRERWLSSSLFSFGVLADVQYADIPNRLNFTKTSMRYYRNSLKCVHDAALSWNNELHKPSFVVHLGDLIDGFNRKEGKANSYKCSQKCTSGI